MVSIFESELSKEKPVRFALANIYGIGLKQSKTICKKLGFSINLKFNDVSEDQIIKIIKTIELSSLLVASDLKKYRSTKFKDLISIKSYRGLRRNAGLPVRGQRTHTNAKTSQRRF
jgi:small subunit ribosomal protein S13